MDDTKRAWLRAHRCPWCERRKQPACPYAVYEQVLGGVVCKGFKRDRGAR